MNHNAQQMKTIKHSWFLCQRNGEANWLQNNIPF